MIAPASYTYVTDGAGLQVYSGGSTAKAIGFADQYVPTTGDYKTTLIAVNKNDTTVKETYTIHVKLDTGMTLRLGTIENVDAKLGWVETLMPRLTEEGKITGTLDVTGENGASYIP